MTVTMGGLSSATGKQRLQNTIAILTDFLKQRSEVKGVQEEKKHLTRVEELNNTQFIVPVDVENTVVGVKYIRQKTERHSDGRQVYETRSCQINSGHVLERSLWGEELEMAAPELRQAVDDDVSPLDR
jgi:hypothetical protein